MLDTNDQLEGVLVAKKDFNLPKHQEIDTKNLYVCILPRSLEAADFPLLTLTRSSKRASP